MFDDQRVGYMYMYVQVVTSDAAGPSNSFLHVQCNYSNFRLPLFVYLSKSTQDTTGTYNGNVR